MSVRAYKVIRVPRQHISDFIIKNHYSAKINGCISDYCFALYDADKMIGAAFFGRLAMAGQWKPYVEKPENIIELRRLCCIDDTPKNTESFFIGKMLKWLQKNTNIKVVVSYADKEHGHQGTIYKASNFEHRGEIKGAKVFILDGKQYHDKSMRSKHNGIIKPFAARLKQAVDSGLAETKITAGKHVYTYNLEEKR